ARGLHKVAGQYDQVAALRRCQRRRAAHDLRGPAAIADMEVRELHYAVAVEGGGQAGYLDVDFAQAQPVALDVRAVEQGGAPGGGEGERHGRRPEEREGRAFHRAILSYSV